MLGQLRFYDEATAWGLVIGEDGRLYAVRRSHMLAPEPEPGDRVTFDPRKTPGGLRAVAVSKADGKTSHAHGSGPPVPGNSLRWGPSQPQRQSAPPG